MTSSPSNEKEKKDFEAMTAAIYRDMWKLSGLPEDVFNARYRVGAVERMRGQHAAATSEKSDFIEGILTRMASGNYIREWSYIGRGGRADYKVCLPSGRIAVIEAKGSMDGNSATILERPAYADELVIWTMTTNPMSDVVKNVWSGLHTRISPEHIATGKRVDLVVAWDTLGSSLRLCPGLEALGPTGENGTSSPPCLYLLPTELPIVGARPTVGAKRLHEVEFAQAAAECFGIPERFVGMVQFEVAEKRDRLARRTTVIFGNEIWKQSSMTPLRRDLTAYRAAAEKELLDCKLETS
jgi:hypothetical protein|nr:hypothetical protein [Neorhizobium tomejilense]